MTLDTSRPNAVTEQAFYSSALQTGNGYGQQKFGNQFFRHRVHAFSRFTYRRRRVKPNAGNEIIETKIFPK